jgi:hypothetical protein
VVRVVRGSKEFFRLNPRPLLEVEAFPAPERRSPIRRVACGKFETGRVGDRRSIPISGSGVQSANVAQIKPLRGKRPGADEKSPQPAPPPPACLTLSAKFMSFRI